MVRLFAGAITAVILILAFQFGRWSGRRGEIRWWEIPIIVVLAAPFNPFSIMAPIAGWALGVSFENRRQANLRHHTRHLAGKMRRCLVRGEIKMHYQAIVDLNTGQWIGAEALARWHCGDEIRPPGEWLEALLQPENAHEFTKRMLLEVCGMMREHRQIRFSVNMTPALLMEPGWSHLLLDTLWTMDVDPQQLSVEVTETMLIQDVDTVRADLDVIRDAGCHVALDDFGTGTASVKNLIDFPINVVKLDRSIVQAPDRRYAEGLIAICLQTGRRVVAEGVETPSQADWLRGLGVQAAQGWLYAKAQPEFEFGMNAFVHGRPPRPGM